MRLLSPIDACTPAFTRTREVLFKPFRVGRSWKLAFCAYIALCGSVVMPFPLFYLGLLKVPSIRERYAPVVWFGVLAITLVSVPIYYLCSRMQLVLFDFVLTPSAFIAPLWRRYGGITWRWLGWKSAVTIPLALLLFLPLVPLFFRAFASLPAAPDPQQPFDPHVFQFFMLVYALSLSGLALLFLAGSLLSDFFLPSIALEAVNASVARARFFALVRAEPLTLAGYVAMRLLLALGGAMLQYAAIFGAMICFGIPLGLIALAGWFALHTIASPVLLAAGGVLLYLLFIAGIFYAQLGAYGVAIIYLRAYSLYFLAGRYPLLAERLEASQPAFP